MTESRSHGIKPVIAGLYAITPETADTTHLVAAVRAAVQGGARAVQYRSKLADTKLKQAQAVALRAITRDQGAILIVNDSIELALTVDADGAHLGSSDGDWALARATLGPDKLLGASCYDRLDLAQQARDAGADYVAFGSVFLSPTKPGAVRASLDLFRQARTELDLPICAIGGITLANAPAVIAAGAHSLAVVSALFDASDIRAAAHDFARLFA